MELAEFSHKADSEIFNHYFYDCLFCKGTGKVKISQILQTEDRYTMCTSCYGCKYNYEDD